MQDEIDDGFMYPVAEGIYNRLAAKNRPGYRCNHPQLAWRLGQLAGLQAVPTENTDIFCWETISLRLLRR